MNAETTSVQVNALKQKTEAISVQVEALKQKIIDFIQALPDADKVKRISPNCGIIKFSDLDPRSFSPDYYFNFELKRRLIEIIQKAHVTSLDGIFSRLIQEKSYQHKDGHREPIRADIIQKIKEMWY